MQIEESEAAPLAAELQQVSGLRVLDLHGNHLLGQGILTILRALGALPELRHAELGMNEIDEEFDEEIGSLRADLEARGVALNIEWSPHHD
jgi:hypothetical protein